MPQQSRQNQFCQEYFIAKLLSWYRPLGIKLPNNAEWSNSKDKVF